MVALTRNMVMDPQNIIKKGYLVKSPPLKKKTSPAKRWCRRWFVFYDPTLSGGSNGKLVLYYFTNQESVKKEKPKEIDLSQCEDIFDRQYPLHGFEHVIDVVTPKRTFHLCADTRQEKDEWLQTLKLRVFSELTMIPNGGAEDKPDNQLQNGISGRDEFERKLETLKRVSASSTTSSLGSNDSQREGSVFDETEVYSPMSFGGTVDRSAYSKTEAIPTSKVLRISQISTESNTSTDDGIVVTPRRGRPSSGESNSGSETIGDEEYGWNCTGFTGPKLTRDSSSIKSQTSPKLMHKCRSMNNLSDNLTRLATQFDERAMRPASDSGALSQSRLSIKRGSRCASLLEEFRQLARLSFTSDTGGEMASKRISESAEELCTNCEVVRIEL